MEHVKMRNAPTLLAVDEDLALRSALEAQLRKVGFRVHGAASLREAGPILAKHFVNLLLVHASVGGECAIRFVEGLRRSGQKIPTIFTLDRTDPASAHESGARLRALEVGDDVLAKPLPFRELVARIHAVLRRAERTNDWHVAENVTLRDADFTFCGATVSPRRMMIFFDNGRRDSFGGKELGLMSFFAARPGQMGTRA